MAKNLTESNNNKTTCGVQLVGKFIVFNIYIRKAVR